jgi:hypothetical protein
MNLGFYFIKTTKRIKNYNRVVALMEVKSFLQEITIFSK